MPLCRNQVLVCGNVNLDCGCSTSISNCLETLQTYRRIRDAALEQSVQNSGETYKPSSRGNLAGIPVREKFKVVLLQSPEPLPGHAGAPLQFCQIYLFEAVFISRLSFHLFKSLGNSLNLLLVIQVLHSTSFPWAVYGSSIPL